MKCKNCPLSWVDDGAKCPTCHADPNWPAPCEYDDDYEEEDPFNENDPYVITDPMAFY